MQWLLELINVVPEFKYVLVHLCAADKYHCFIGLFDPAGRRSYMVQSYLSLQIDIYRWDTYICTDQPSTGTIYKLVMKRLELTRKQGSVPRPEQRRRQEY
jgi:hypothetical protein